MSYDEIYRLQAVSVAEDWQQYTTGYGHKITETAEQLTDRAERAVIRRLLQKFIGGQDLYWGLVESEIRDL